MNVTTPAADAVITAYAERMFTSCFGCADTIEPSEHDHRMAVCSTCGEENHFEDHELNAEDVVRDLDLDGFRKLAADLKVDLDGYRS